MKLGKKVFVGLSGGVDSSVSAALLKEQGYDVTGVFIKVWSPEFLECTWKEDRRDAMRVCAELDIPFETLDLEAEYKKEVVDYMIAEYTAGRTPNPDVMCNRYVKFGGFLRYALSRGADYIATGHYAQNIFNPQKATYELWAGADKNKDQSYFLWTLTQKDLEHVLFPVGHLEKPQVRALAEKFGLPTATKRDSQGLCFLGQLDIKEFLEHFVPQRAGKVFDQKGQVIGAHDGALFYTLGQRHGFEVSGGIPLYILAKDVTANTLTVGETPAELSAGDSFALSRVNWIAEAPVGTRAYLARSRYRESLFTCHIESRKDEVLVTLDSGMAAIPPGQSFVAYEKRGEGLVCIGGGVII